MDMINYGGACFIFERGYTMFAFNLTVIILLGLIMGSFTNVMIYRIPEKVSLWSPPSTCKNCKTQIKWYDNIPVISYLILGGKCRNCDERISIQYPLVEAVCGILFAVIFLVHGISLDFLFTAVISVVLVAISVIDLRSMTIPNGLVISLIVISSLYTTCRFIFPGLFSGTITWFDPLIGFVAASLPLLLIAVITKGGMGGGDIKLMAAAGIFLGWKGILVALLVGSLIGAVVSSVLMLMGKKNRKDMIPFGPFLCLGILFAALFANPIIEWYARLLTF